MMDTVKIVDAAALTDYKLTKCRAIVSVPQWKFPDEGNILDVASIKKEIEDNEISSNYDFFSLSTEESLNNCDHLSNIKTEDFTSKFIESDLGILDEENILDVASIKKEIEDNVPKNKISRNYDDSSLSTEESLNDCDHLSNIKTEEFASVDIKEEDFGYDKKHSTDVGCETAPEVESKTTNRKRNFLLQSHEVREENAFQCETCESKFNSNRGLRRHINAVHLKLKPYKCEQCDYTSSESGRMKSHNKTVHMKLKPFKCEHCVYTSSESRWVKRHNRAVHMKLKPFKCDHCDYTSSESRRVKSHNRAVHMKLRPFKCEYCKYACSDSSNLKFHNKTVHMKLKPFKCEHCDYSCCKRSSFNNHILRVHRK